MTFRQLNGAFLSCPVKTLYKGIMGRILVFETRMWQIVAVIFEKNSLHNTSYRCSYQFMWCMWTRLVKIDILEVEVTHW